MTKWTIYFMDGTRANGVVPLKLYYSGTAVRCTPDGPQVQQCDCESSDDEVTVELLQDSGNFVLDAGRTQVTRAPVSAPDALWRPATASSVLLALPNAVHAGWWSWEYAPIGALPGEPVALKVKVRVKRPPIDRRRAPR